jgi:ubiquinone/menaquinone biosynthesis C-methylase UbiE
MKETYTPGQNEQAIAFMSRRRLDPNGAFFLRFLGPGISVLDCGCGPGSITCDIARRIAPGKVIGLDASAAALVIAARRAQESGIGNLAFEQGSVYSLPFRDASFDAVFSHALLEHLAQPQRAVNEFFRVLKPGGALGVCTPDWGGFIVTPETPQLLAAIEAYKALQNRNGGDVLTGRRLGDYFAAAGFSRIEQQARYESYQPRITIGDFLAMNLEEAGDASSAATWRAWARAGHGMFAQAWISCTGIKPA